METISPLNLELILTMVTKYTQWLDLAYLNRVQTLADKGICREQGLHSRPQKKYFGQQELDRKNSTSVAIWWIKLCNQEHIGSSVQRAVDVLKAFTLSLAAQYIIKKTSIYCPKKVIRISVQQSVKRELPYQIELCHVLTHGYQQRGPEVLN